MNYIELRPPSALAEQVQLVWAMEFEDPAQFGAADRILPDGIGELVFHYGEPFEMRFAGESYGRQPRSFAVSQTRRYLEVRPIGPGGMVGVRFFPWGLRGLLAMPLSELADSSVSARSLWGREAELLEERLAEAADVRARLVLVAEFLRARNGHHTPEVASWVHSVRRWRGRVGVAEMARRLGVSERRMQRGFRDAVGVSPKHYSRIVRFLESCRAMRAESSRGLAEIALDSGYYDQAHLTNDFRAFSGLTPTQFLRQRRLSFLDPEP